MTQADLIKRAFAGDDVQADFEAAKAAEVEEEVPKQASMCNINTLRVHLKSKLQLSPATWLQIELLHIILLATRRSGTVDRT